MASQDPRGPAERWGGGGAGPQTGGGANGGGRPGTGGGGGPAKPAETDYGAPIHEDLSKYGTNPDGSPTRWARTPESLAAMNSRIDKYNNDTIGDMLLGFLGVHKRKPGTDRMYNNPDIGRVWDPVETGLMIGGMLNPALKALSVGYTAAKLLTGWEGAAVPLNEQKGPYLGKPDGSGLTGSVANPATPGPGGAPRIGDSGVPARLAPIPNAALNGSQASAAPIQNAALSTSSLVAPFQALLAPSGRGRQSGVALLGAPSGGI